MLLILFWYKSKLTLYCRLQEHPIIKTALQIKTRGLETLHCIIRHARHERNTFEYIFSL